MTLRPTGPYNAVDSRGRLVGVLVVEVSTSFSLVWRWAGQRTLQTEDPPAHLTLVPATWPKPPVRPRVRP